MTFKLANWPAPKNISALTTTRLSGFSQSPWDSNNLGLHVGDNPDHVLKNRQQLTSLLNLPADPIWLNQTHTTTCVIAETDFTRDADAAISHSMSHPLVIMTADCLPITLCNLQGTEIAAIHAGWKGLCNGIIDNTLDKMTSKPAELIAWIGASICQKCYETGHEVFEACVNKYPFCKNAFKINDSKCFANLPLIAEMLLKAYGVHAVYQSGLCTYELKNEFYSYRREKQTGRIGTLIWFNDQPQDK